VFKVQVVEVLCFDAVLQVFILRRLFRLAVYNVVISRGRPWTMSRGVENRASLAEVATIPSFCECWWAQFSMGKV
jgi:hypothetical protein